MNIIKKLLLHTFLLLNFIVFFGIVSLLVGCGSDEGANVTDTTATTDLTQKEEGKGEKSEPAIIGDPLIGMELAKQSCAECHGTDGVKAKDSAPFIAGLEQQYLIRTMLAYSNGSREHEKMKESTESLKPNQIGDVSAYYATLSTPWQGGEIIKKRRLVHDRMAVGRGKKAAKTCDVCHNTAGRIKRPGTPSLSGLQPEYFNKSLNSYFNGERDNRFMKLLSYTLEKKSVKDITAYYAAQSPVQPPEGTSKDDPALKRGERASLPCAGCHGLDGNSPNPNIPSLAGQPVEYLFTATLDYRDGLRKNSLMREEVRQLSNQKIRDIALYFATQKADISLFYKAEDSNHFDPVGDGGRIASACDGCHGINGNSTTKGIPSLTGLHLDYLTQATAAYLNGERDNERMRVMVDFLDEVNIEKVSFFYATQKPNKGSSADDEKLKTGEEISEKCVSCHGERGVSHNPENPSLAGQDERYLIKATKEYKNDLRKHDGMKGAVEKLSDGEISSVARYYSAQKAEKPKEVYLPEESSLLIETRCVLCHGEKGFSSDYDKPRLAGQSEGYLIESMKQYKSGIRKHNAMNAMAEVLSLIEMKDIAAYYARQRPDSNKTK